MKNFNYYSTATKNLYPENYSNKEEYRIKKEMWRKEIMELKLEFKKDLFEEFGVSDNSKAERCFEIAWDKWHSYGYEEVYNEFSELVDLIK